MTEPSKPAAETSAPVHTVGCPCPDCSWDYSVPPLSAVTTAAESPKPAGDGVAELLLNQIEDICKRSVIEDDFNRATLGRLFAELRRCVADLQRRLNLESTLRVQCSEDSQMHLDKFTALRQQYGRLHEAAHDALTLGWPIHKCKALDAILQEPTP